MSLISAADQVTAAEDFEAMTGPVRLLFFTQTLDCDTCLQTRQILDELPLLSDRITIDEVNFVLEPTRRGVRHRPGAGDRAASAEDEAGPRARLAHPLPRHAGRLRVHLADPGILLVGGGASQLSERAARASPRSIAPITMHVFSTPTCPHCPRAVTVAHEMACANPHITAYAVEVDRVSRSRAPLPGHRRAEDGRRRLQSRSSAPFPRTPSSSRRWPAFTRSARSWTT